MERESLEALVRREEDVLYRAALAYLGEPEEAKDVVQDAFLRLLEKAPALEGPEHERAWLLRVTINRCRDRLRFRRRHPTVPLTDWYPAAAPEESAAAEAVSALPPKDRLTIHLFYYQGCSVSEIAALTGAREGAVRTRLSRARQKLRHLLEGST